MDKKLYVWGMEGREEGKINPETTKSQVIDLDATLSELATNIQSVEDELTSEIDAKIINVQSVGNVTVEGISVPSLSEGQVIAIHNAIVNKQMAIVNSVDGTGHFVVNQADSLNNEISVEFVYYATALVTYTVDNHSVVVSVKKFESGGGGGEKLYFQKVWIGEGMLERPQEFYIYTTKSTALTWFDLNLERNSDNFAKNIKKVMIFDETGPIVISECIVATNIDGQYHFAYDIAGTRKVFTGYDFFNFEVKQIREI